MDQISLLGGRKEGVPCMIGEERCDCLYQEFIDRLNPVVRIDDDVLIPGAVEEIGIQVSGSQLQNLLANVVEMCVGLQGS